MTDRTRPSNGLGTPPQPDASARERAIADALAHFDDLIVDGVLTPAGEADVAAEAEGGDDLDRRRRAKGRRRSAPQRWLAAAAVLLVLGAGGALAAQVIGGSGEQMTSEASDQAEGGATNADEAARAERGVADQTKAGGAEPAAEAAPEAAAQALATLPEWLCELTARLGVDVCAR
ncbi:MAG: hypothetical protein IPN02_08945 [Candidatus Microthrix sp.]|uniref:Uncharacterized protein n=1 Tax=Candidatus Neomicrothrix subdominans TaxID=2954438 RepID=A0A936NC55_9ACTN|nr:hypothetical protein [Candidatus Microthrix subdominans]